MASDWQAEKAKRPSTFVVATRFSWATMTCAFASGVLAESWTTPVIGNVTVAALESVFLVSTFVVLAAAPVAITLRRRGARFETPSRA